MPTTYKAGEIETGYHPQGFRIDKTTSPLNRYTRWTIGPDGRWAGPKPVCFDSMPADGWVKTEGFDWSAAGKSKEYAA